MGSLSSPEQLSVGVVGAGIAGLGAAIALRNAGHQVEIFEQSQFKYEIGAAITLPPNGVVALKQLRVDPSPAKPVIAEHYELLSGESLQTVAQMDFVSGPEGMKTQYGNDMLMFSRVELHNHLRAEAVSPSRPGPPVQINLGCKTKDIDCHRGVITLEDDRCFQKDLVIVADGIHTRFVPAITGKDIAPTKNGRSAFRGLMPFEAIKAHPDLSAYLQKYRTGFWIAGSPDHSVHMVTYPCGQTGYMNLALLHYTLPENAHKDDWSSPATPEDCIAATKGFHPLLHQLLKLSTDTKVHTLQIKQPLPTLFKGRAVIIGDAAAPHQPQLAQGATSALVSAAALGMIFSELQDTHARPANAANLTVEERLDIFNDIIRYRISLGQLMTDAVPYNPNDPVKVDRRKQLEALAEGRDVLPATDDPPLGKTVRDPLYGYDVTKDVTNNLRQRGLAVVV